MMIRPGSDEAKGAGRNASVAPSATGLKIFIADDDAAVAELLGELVSDIGHVAAAVETSHAAALAAADHVQADLAILDINLHGKPSFAIADRLAARGIPVIFATGYGILELSGKYADAELLKKPFRAPDLAQAVERAMAAKAPAITSGAWRESRLRGKSSN